MAVCLLGLGSNLGNRAAVLQQAIDCLCQDPQISGQAASAFHETAPIGGPAGQGAYLNAALRVTTSLTPAQLLARALQVERNLGRERSARWGPRCIDIDLLLYGTTVLQTPEMTIPHPRMAIRRFVLRPACDVAAEMIHPPTGWTLRRLLERLEERPHYVAICGADPQRGRELAAAAAARLGIDLITTPVRDASGTGAGSWPGDLEKYGRALEEHCGLLSAAVAGRAPDRPLLSDFWIGQFLVQARLQCSAAPSARDESLELFARLTRGVPQPHFTLYVADSGEAAAGASGGRRADARTARYAQFLRAELFAAGRGPVLAVPGDHDRALTELQAGMDAMR